MDNSNASEKILVALDGSLIAENAANIALQIAPANHFEVLGLYVVDEPLILDPYADHFKELGYDEETASRAKLIDWYEDVGSRALDRLRELCTQKNIFIETELLLGDVRALILKNAEQASYLALGRRGNSHMPSPDQLGENFKHIAHHVKVPMIVGGDVSRPIKRMLLLYDQDRITDSTIDLLNRIQKTLQADLIIGAQGSAKTGGNLAILQDRLSEHGLKIEKVIDLVAISMEEIGDVLDRNLVDLLFMSRYQHSEIISWLADSPVDQILRQTPLPVILA